MSDASPRAHRPAHRREPRSLSRRGLLIAGAAGGAAIAIPSISSAGPKAATGNHVAGAAGAGAVGTALPKVQPISSRRAYRAFGVCSHPNFGATVYKNTTDWMYMLAKTGASYFRGLYADNITATQVTIASARKHGIQWGMTVVPDDWSLSDAALIKRINHIAEHAADICLYVEGVNEPNHERDGSKAPADWVARTIQKQKIIWNAVKSDPRLKNVRVVGPSLHAVAATEADYAALGRAGLANYMDFAGLHRYPNGKYPDQLLDEKIGWVNKYWGGKRVWITETGYTNSIADGGFNPVPEDISARYAPSALLEAVDRDCKVAWYELLDDPDAGAKNVRESNFGMFATDSIAGPFRAKPVVPAMRQILDSLRDDGVGYTPAAIPLRITSAAKDVRSTVIARRDGTVTVFLRRSLPCWDTKARKRIEVPFTDVKIESAKGTQTVRVDDFVKAVRL
jgi:hypothetical protein